MFRPAALLTALFLAPPAWAEAPTAWHPEAADLCLFPPYDQSRTEHHRSAQALIAAIEGLHPDPDPLLIVLKENGTAICTEPRPSIARGAYNVEQNVIELRSDLDPGERLLILIHELRHLDQFDRGFCPTVDVDIREMERFTFMVEADAQAVATYYAWQLAQSGQPEAWHAILRLKEYADIGAVFANRVGEGVAPELAVEAAFDAWFTSTWRVETYRLSACTAYLDRLDETKLLRKYDRFPPDYFADLCRLPDGASYDCRGPD